MKERICSFLEKTELFFRKNVSDRGLFWLVWGILFLSWLPAFLACFPGTYGYDVPIQVAQVFRIGGLTLDACNPLAHTLLVSGFVALGGLLHNYPLGYALFILFQMIIVDTGCAKMIVFLRRKNCKWPLLAMGMLWLMFHPGIQILVVNGTKDVLFGVFLLLFAMDFWDCVERKKPTRGMLIRMGISALLLCLFRNIGTSMVLLLLLLCVLCKQWKKGIIGVLIGVYLLMGVFSFICTSGFHLEQSNKRELLSLPMQQMAFVAYSALEGDGAVQVTEEQMEAVYELIPDWKVLTEFVPWSADPVKSVFQTDVLAANPGKYLKLYFQLGMQNPRYYLFETVRMLEGYFDMMRNQNLHLSMESSFPNLNEFGITLRSKLPGYYNYLMNCVMRQRMTVFWRLSGIGFWLIGISFLFDLFRRSGAMLLVRMPFLFYAVGILFGPVALLRYLFPILIATPLLFGTMFLKESAEEKVN